MKANIKRIVLPLLIIAFWIGVWYLLSIIINNAYLFPSPHTTAVALFGIVTSVDFFKVIMYTLLRVVSGILLGILGGAALAVLAHKLSVFRRILSPFISIIKATPVVTFIVLLWISMNGNALTVFIAFLMVMPIIWQNLLDGFDSISPELVEVCDIFEFSALKRFKILTFPALFKYFVPAVITSIGLAWKAEIAAEIIAYTKVSIGQFIYDARYNLQTDKVFGWVIIIVSFSILLEFGTKKLLGSFKR